MKLNIQLRVINKSGIDDLKNLVGVTFIFPKVGYFQAVCKTSY